MRAVADRFWEKVDKRGPVPRHDPSLGHCWVWTASTSRGYGQIYLDGSPQKAHRVSLMLAGFDPSGFEVRHRCDNPPCVRPSHLLRGTHAENMDDASKRGLMPGHPGELHPDARLSESDIINIREAVASGETRRSVARRYQIDESHISKIARGLKWSHIGGPLTIHHRKRKAIQHGK